jgi:hydrogenase nickel incorporation protein HypA/HybF
VHRIVVAAAREHALESVAEVRLDVGRVSGVSVDALSFAWNFIRDTDPLTRAAALAISQPEGRGRCAHCGFAGPIADFIRICPKCGAGGLAILDGEQFMVTGISGEEAHQSSPKE